MGYSGASSGATGLDRLLKRFRGSPYDGLVAWQSRSAHAGKASGKGGSTAEDAECDVLMRVREDVRLLSSR